MTLSRWHEDLAAHDEAFACLQDLLDPSSFATTVVKAFREWGQGLLRLATALVRENAALERENATLRDRIAELERSAALDSTTSSKPPASDGLRKKSGTQRRTRSQRGKSGRPSGGQHNKAVASNLLDQNFSAEAPNEKWAADISYIWTAQGWLYLAVMLDLYSRRVIGWAVGARMTSDLPLRALNRAIGLRQPGAGVIHHSDSEYLRAGSLGVT